MGVLNIFWLEFSMGIIKLGECFSQIVIPSYFVGGMGEGSTNTFWLALGKDGVCVCMGRIITQPFRFLFLKDLHPPPPRIHL